mmetsp:Transcript_2177/g.3710  ORF Transcript_2177/g.3710 Transcript_2177/m.3710 type:complete len:166 (+) Transcript_2177:94-591(+)
MFLCCCKPEKPAEKAQVLTHGKNEAGPPSAEMDPLATTQQEEVRPLEPEFAEASQLEPLIADPVAEEVADDPASKDFTVTLVREKGQKLGMRVGEPPEDPNRSFVRLVTSDGLVDSWNKSNPDKQVVVGCELLQVNKETKHAEMFGQISNPDIATLVLVIRPPAI